ncbi:photosystem II protein Y [Aphanothece sacrum]|jgi:photosystem II PsbY protein|nr:photosystem II protein Y [Aphanothece sacrum]
MDWRVLIVISPLLIAASWAVFNIAAAALRQLQNFTSRES